MDWISNKDMPVSCNDENVTFISSYKPEENMSQNIMSCLASKPFCAASNSSSLAPHEEVL